MAPLRPSDALVPATWVVAMLVREISITGVLSLVVGVWPTAFFTSSVRAFITLSPWAWEPLS